jgi:hypothetical protein
MTEDHEPINPKIHANLTGLGYKHEVYPSLYLDPYDHYYREVETERGVTTTGFSIDCYRDGSIRIGGMPDSHTGDLLRFLAIALGGG